MSVEVEPPSPSPMLPSGEEGLVLYFRALERFCMETRFEVEAFVGMGNDDVVVWL